MARIFLMRKKRILFLTLALAMSLSLAAQNTAPQTKKMITRGCELFELGRWADARHEFQTARRELSAADRDLRQQVDYFLAACAVELGNGDAVVALLDFKDRYPGSVYTDDVDFSLASYYCANGDMQRAAEFFNKVDYGSLNASRKEQYNLRMGYVEFSKGNYDRAFACYDRISPKSEYADHATYYKSYICYQRGDFALAKQGFNSLRRSESYGDVVPYFLLQIEFQEGNYAYVTENGDRLVRKAVPERRAEIERVVAEAWFRMDNYNETLTHMNAYTTAGGKEDRESCYLKGFSLYRLTQYNEAAEYLRKACGAKDALTQNASFHLADCYLRQGDKQAAMQSFAMAADESLDREIAEDALFNYAKLQYELGGGAFNGAINVLQRYITTYPESKRLNEVRTLLIAAYYNSQDYDTAYRAIKSMPTDDPDVMTALQKIAYFRGLEAYKNGDVNAAREFLNESARVGVSPKYSALNTFWQGEIAFSKGDYTVAAVKFDTFLRQAPRTEAEYGYAWYNLGYCAFNGGELSKATSNFNRFLQNHSARDRYRADAYNRLGDISASNHRYDEALKHYESAVRIGGREGDYATYKRAMTFGLMGREKDRQYVLKQIARSGSGDFAERSAYELGHGSILGERYSEGVHELERFLERYPSSSLRGDALSDLGLAYLNLGNRQKALEYYKRTIAEAPQSANARNAMQGIREIYVAEGDVDGYFDYAHKMGMEGDLTQVSRDSLSFVAAQKIYLKGQHETASKSLRSYLTSYPKGYYTSDALYYLSDCYLKLGEREPAIETLTELSEKQGNPYMETALERLSTMTFEDKRYAEAATAYRKFYTATSGRQKREAAMTGYVRATVALHDADKIRQMAEDVRGVSDAGATARREATFALAEQLRTTGHRDKAVPLYKELASSLQTDEGSAAGFYLIEELFVKGDLAKAEKEVFRYSEHKPKAYWLAKSYILLGDIYLHNGDQFQARATWQSVADGYTPTDDGIVEEATKRIRNLK